MQEIFERRFRWTVRQVLVAVKETEEEAVSGGKATASERERRALIQSRLAALHNFFSMIDVGIGAFVRGEAFPAEELQNVASSARRSG